MDMLLQFYRKQICVDNLKCTPSWQGKSIAWLELLSFVAFSHSQTYEARVSILLILFSCCMNNSLKKNFSLHEYKNQSLLLMNLEAHQDGIETAENSNNTIECTIWSNFVHIGTNIKGSFILISAVLSYHLHEIHLEVLWELPGSCMEWKGNWRESPDWGSQKQLQPASTVPWPPDSVVYFCFSRSLLIVQHQNYNQKRGELMYIICNITQFWRWNCRQYTLKLTKWGVQDTELL